MIRLVQIFFTFLLAIHIQWGFTQSQSITEVEWTMELDSFQLFGTLATPENPRQVAILFISGSGPTDRDGNNPFMKNNSLKGLSDSLVLEGFTTMRFDKRGIGKSATHTMDESQLTFETFVNDASQWLSRLKDTFPDYKFIIAGHSEGSLIGILVAQRNQVDGFISIAGAGRPFEVIVREQLGKQLPGLVPESDSIVHRIKSGETVDEMNPMLLSLYRPSVQPYLRSYMKYDPKTEIGKLDVPILIVQGENDLQITTDDARTLYNGGNKATLQLIPHMNHVLKDIKGGLMENQTSYNNPELPISAALLEHVLEFLNKF